MKWWPMKNRLCGVLIVAFLLFAVVANAIGVRYGTTIVATAGAQTSVTHKSGYLSKVVMVGDKTTTNTWNLYDYGTNQPSCTTTEKEIIPTLVVTTAEAYDRYIELNFDPPVNFMFGLYAVLTSTGEMKVYYKSD